VPGFNLENCNTFTGRQVALAEPKNLSDDKYIDALFDLDASLDCLPTLPPFPCADDNLTENLNSELDHENNLCEITASGLS
jgi:hypothetical protein